MKNFRISTKSIVIMSFVVSISAMALIAYIGFCDLLNIDRFVARFCFGVRHWDINFYSVATIIISLCVPIVAVLITIGFTSKKATELRIKTILDFVGRFNRMHNYALSLFSAFQSFPKDKEAKERELVFRYTEFVNFYNEFIFEFGTVKIFTREDITIDSDINTYRELTRKALDFWKMYYFDGKGEVKEYYSDFHISSKAFCDKAPDLYEQIVGKFANIVENLEQ